MTTDPFEQLRVDDEPARPDPRFVARLRARVARRARSPTTCPPIPLPERTAAMTDTATSPRATVDADDRTSASARPPTPSPGTATCFGAVETIRYTGDDGRIGHAELDIAGAQVMLSDEYPELDVRAPTSIGGTPVTLHLEVPDVDATYERVVAAGGRAAGAARGRGLRRPLVLDARPVRPPLDGPDPDRDAEPGRAAGAACEGYTITAADRRRRPRPARRRARLLHARRAGHGRGRALLRRSCSGGRPRPAAPATSTPTSATPSCRSGSRRARPTSRRCCTSGSTTSHAYAARVRRARRRGASARRSYDSGPERRVPRRPGPPVRALAAGARLRVSSRGRTLRSRPRRWPPARSAGTRPVPRTTTSFVAEVDVDRLDTGARRRPRRARRARSGRRSCRAR